METELTSLKQYSGKLIAIVEDEPDIAGLIAINLQKAGFRIKELHSGDKLFKLLRDIIPDIIILDLMLPDTDGFEICKYLKSSKSYSDTPIIILTARSEETDKVLGLELGADDYITKPFSPRELVARVKNILRREDREKFRSVVRIDNILKVDFQKFEVIVENQKIELTTTEFKILKLLAERRGWVFSRSQILDTIDSQDKGVLDRTVDVHIKNLRDKLGSAGAMIKNIRGIGYKLE